MAATSALIFCAALGLTQSVKAEGAFTVADINSALRGSGQAVSSEKTSQAGQQYTNDQALSALSAYAQQLGTPQSASIKIDDDAFAALRDFAQRVGSAQPESIKALPKLAEAGSLLEFLQQGGSSQSAPADKAKAPAAPAKRSGPPVEAHFVGAKACLTCHASVTAEFEKTLMGRIGKTQKGKFECENCHGPGSAHVKAGGGRGVGGILSFGETDPRSAEEKNTVCLACHQKGARNNWPGSTHETRGLACTNCHTVMKNVSRKSQLKTAFQPDTCFQCHKDRKAQIYRSSHMPIREGKMTCSDCHNPHGSVTESLLKKESVNEVCYTCHAERRGPFLFEHAPVRENCVNCHDPHGSINEYSLKLSRPRLCFECHSIGHGTTTGLSATRTVGVACQNCHTNIHGSNSPAGAFFWR